VTICLLTTESICFVDQMFVCSQLRVFALLTRCLFVHNWEYLLCWPDVWMFTTESICFVDQMFGCI